MLVLFLEFGISTWAVASQPITHFAPPICTAMVKNAGCVTHQPTLADMVQAKQDQVLRSGQLLLLPGSLSIITYLLVNILFVPIITLVGTRGI